MLNYLSYLSIDEFEKMTKKLEITCSKKYLNQAFSKLDKNNDGYLEFEEFYNFMLRDPFMSS